MLCFAALAFLCQQHPQLKTDVCIYVPEKTIAQQHITLKRWGGGFLTQSEWVVLYGRHSLRLVGSNSFQGGAIVFGNPVDLKSAYSDPNKSLRFSFFLEDKKVSYPYTAKNTIVRHQGRQSYPAQARSVALSSQIKNVRLIATTTDGNRSEFYYPVIAAQRSTVEGWRTAAIPLRAFNGMARSNMQLKELYLALDARGIMYVGDMDIAIDPNPITAEVKPGRANIKAGSSLIFSAVGEAGLTPLKYLWDFDDSDGIQVDADAQTVKHIFKRTGSYRVTVTVVDRFGVKKPVSKNVTVTVKR